MERKLWELGGSVSSPDYRAISTEMTVSTGIPFTSDQVRLKLNRMHEALELADKTPVISIDEQSHIEPTPEGEYVGLRQVFFDIESTNLSGNVGRVLCASFADAFGNVSTLKYTDFPGKTIIDDGPLVQAISEELSRWDIWTSWNGKLFDAPFLNARLLKAGHPPLRKDRMHLDLMYYAKGGFMRMGSARLQSVSQFFNTPNAKSPLTFETWELAMSGDEKALDYIVEHCEADVLVLRDVFRHLKSHVTILHR